MDVVNYYKLNDNEYLGDTCEGIVMKAIVLEGERFKWASWNPANEVETRLYRAWRDYIDTTYEYEYSYEFE